LAHLILKEVFMREPRRPIQVLQTMMERQVLKEDLHQVQKNPLYLTANKGFIQLQGEHEDLQALYDAGVSMRRLLGLGLLEMAKVVYSLEQMEVHMNEWAFNQGMVGYK